MLSILYVLKMINHRLFLVSLMNEYFHVQLITIVELKSETSIIYILNHNSTVANIDKIKH